MTTALDALGRDGGDRVLIPHIDDVGGSFGSNRSMVELAAAGFVTCGSVMVPSGWFAGIAATAYPELDLGIHLTLTSESASYRWRPVSTVSRASGLVDPDGFMWADVASVRAHAHPDAVEAELRAQVDTALAAGLDVTHLDHHMGASVAPEFVEITAAIASDYRLPLMLPDDLASFYGVMDQPPDDIGAAEAVRDALAAHGKIVVDRFEMGLAHQREDAAAVMERLVAGAPPGVTFVSLHCATSGDIEPIHPNDAHWRIAEDAVLRSHRFTSWARDHGVELVGFREIRDAVCRAFVPPGFAVPPRFEGPGFGLEPLSPRHNERDHAAWTSSIDHIRRTPGFDPAAEWPVPMSLAENLADLERHADDFAARRGFTYSILDGDAVIGCLYIYPSPDDDHDADVRSWVTADRSDMDAVVRREVARWMEAVWPFARPRYASRD